MQNPHDPKMCSVGHIPLPRNAPQYEQNVKTPFIRILAVADVDLRSTAALAEYTLRQRHKVPSSGEADNEFSASLLGSGDVDLCLVIGPFVHDLDETVNGNDVEPGEWDDLYEEDLPFRLRRQRQQQKRRHQQIGTVQDSDGENHLSGLSRKSREEEAADEGTISAALAQLETIVCRVCYIPGYSDPATLYGIPHNINTGSFCNSNFPKMALRKKNADGFLPQQNTELNYHKRLTPNSRNMHKRWLQLAPGLGCVGLSELSPPFHFQENETLAHNADEKIREEENDNVDQDDFSDFLDQVKMFESLHNRRESFFEDFDSDNTTIKNPCDSSIFEEQRKGREIYTESMQMLLKLAPPTTSPDQMNNPIMNGGVQFSEDISQVIAMSHFHPSTMDGVERKGTGRRENIKEGSKSNIKDSKWKTPCPHKCREFLNSTEAQRQVPLKLVFPRDGLDLNGEECALDQFKLNCGNIHVVAPGSLRKNGDFALIDVALVCEEEVSTIGQHPSPKKKGTGTIETIRNEICGISQDCTENIRSQSDVYEECCILKNSDRHSQKVIGVPRYRWKVSRTNFFSLLNN